MVASRKATKNMDNAISFEQIPTKNLSIILSKDDMESKNVSTGTDQCMSGINISNNCIFKLNNQNTEITGLSKDSKLNPMRIKNLPVRSRYALFYNVCTQKHVTDFTTTGCHLRHRDREPSRIQVKWLTRKFGKSRLLRKRLRHTIKRSVPRSSHLHYIVENIMHCQDITMKCNPDVYCPMKVHTKCRTNCSANNLKFYICEGILADIFYLSGSTNDLYAQQVYKNVNHLKNVCQSALRTDIETNPGPIFYIDPSKTISAPYSQVFDRDYIFEYSESYSGNVIGDCSIEGYQYCVPFHRSFDLLLAENYSAFILTIDSNAVCIFSTTDGKYKVFDSHSRDIYGRGHPQGTCVLLEAPNINNVILYFQSLYRENSQFELRGINIEEVQANCDQNLNNSIRNSALSGNASDESKSTDVSCLCRQCCAISLYSICYSVIKPCNYWDSNTVAAVVYFGTTLYNNTGINTSCDIPQKVEICGTEIDVKLQANIQGIVYDQTKSKLHIESLICHTNETQGF
ncbi:Hypothetical predicted protein [Paramuricea clavata]|uniref:Uncharacterized protein n=1 Tax=Paramuricea clavata TaxID=317549 RepID=A0A6S7KJW5_PARCT|nr:Hypothetical predicted protein [Paramuricea clavata]